MLIVTLPSVVEEELIEKMASHPMVGGLRYNTGTKSPYSPKETLERILAVIAKRTAKGFSRKELWIDLKGRQLRIARWAVPRYGEIVLDHDFSVDLPARIYFRGDEWSTIKAIKGRTVYVDPPPRFAVGEGQAVNITGNNLKVKGYLTPSDRKYIAVACQLGIFNFMLSFVEDPGDISETSFCVSSNTPSTLQKNAVKFVLKIESRQGLDFADKYPPDPCTLMAARDDLMTNIGTNKSAIINALKFIVDKDPDAIVASRIFSSFKDGSEVSLADISDVYLMHLLGYRNFMLDDSVSQKHFAEAMNQWGCFNSSFGSTFKSKR